MSDEDDAYEVGYGRPPRHSRFRRGQSGNPGGRPKGSASFRDVLVREAMRHVQVTEDGIRTEATKLQVAAKALFQKAMKGDVAAGRLLQAVLASDAEDATAPAPRHSLTEADVATMASHADWLAIVEAAKRDGGDNGSDDAEDHDERDAS